MHTAMAMDVLAAIRVAHRRRKAGDTAPIIALVDDLDKQADDARRAIAAGCVAVVERRATGVLAALGVPDPLWLRLARRAAVAGWGL